MQNDRKFKKDLNLSDSAKYINIQFSVAQVMKNSGSTKLDIKKYINVAFKPLLEESFIDKFKFK